MHQRTLKVVFGLMIPIAFLNAQTDAVLDTLNPLGTTPTGLRLEGASFFFTHSSLSTGLGSIGNEMPLSATTEIGGSATIGYSKSTGRSELSFSYTPSYTQQFQYFSGRLVNHTLNINWNRHLTPRLTAVVMISGSLASVTEAGFPSTVATGITDSSGSAASSGGTGSSPSNQLASVASGPPAITVPATLLIFGERSLVTSIQGTLSYAYSGRLTFHTTAGANRWQNLKDPSLTESQNSYLLAHTTGASLGIGMDYLLSPVTRIGVDLSTYRGISNLEDSYANAGNVSLTHALGRNWVIQGQGGTGFVVYNHQTTYIPQGPQYNLGGSISYRRGTHNFSASATRSFLDSYALGASSSLSTSGAWSWAPRGHSWSLSANVGDQRLTGSGFHTVTSWQASAGFSKRVSRQISLSTEYAYLSGLGFIGGGQSPGGQHMIRLSVNWLPHGFGF